MAGHRHRGARAHLGAHRQRQDARGLPLGPRPALARAGRAHAPGLRLAAEGARLRRRPQPARAAEGHRRGPLGRHPHRRHAPARARRDAPHAAGHPHHDARVAVPDPHLAGARDAARRRVGHRRRDPRRRLDQARRAPRAHARAPVRAQRARASAHRPQRHPEPAGGGRALHGRPAAHRADRRRGHPQAPGPQDPRAGRVDGRARPDTDARALRRAARRRHAAVDLARDLSGAARARPRAPFDDRLRQQPPQRRAPGPAPQRAGRRGDLARPPRLAGARGAHRGRGDAQGRRAAVPDRDVVARARHRHGRGRPRAAGRVAQVGRPRAAAHRARRALGGRHEQGPHLPQVPRGPARVRGRRQAHARGTHRADRGAAQCPRRTRPADRRDRGERRDGGDLRRRALRARHADALLCRAVARSAGERP